MTKKLTFIGGGSTGTAAAAYFATQGFETTLCDNSAYSSHFQEIEAMGGVLIRGKLRGLGKIKTLTHDFSQAVKAADIIFINVVAYRHEEIARLIAPYMEDGQHIIICPGNLGSFVFRKVFQEMGVSKDITVSDLEGNLFPCRLTGVAEATIGTPLGPKGIASYPCRDTPRVIDALHDVMPLRPNKNVFECAINSTNFVMHLGTTILSTALICHRGDQYNLFLEGLVPPALSCSDQVDQERQAIITAMGLKAHATPLEFMTALIHPEETPDLDVFRTLGGPDSIDHRYLTEDALCCGAFCVSVGRRLGLSAPLLTAFITIAGALNGKDYLKEGRTLENLGFDSKMSYDEIVALL